MTGRPTGALFFAAVVAAAALEFGTEESVLLGPQRTRHAVAPRHVAMYLIYRETFYSLPQVGALFGRDHTTVLHAVRRVRGDPDLLVRAAAVLARAAAAPHREPPKVAA